MSNPITDLKRELLAAAERQHQHVTAPVNTERRRWYARASRIVPIAAAVAVAAAVALLLTSPWNTSPSFVDKAGAAVIKKTEAALTPPPGTILHEKWAAVQHFDGLDGHSPCTVESTAEYWIDERTQRFRAVMDNAGYPPYPHPPSLSEKERIGCSRQPPYEIGGFVGVPGHVYQFVPPNRLGRAPSNVMAAGSDELDPVGEIRNAIAAGQAFDQGKTELHGRTVEHICLAASRLDCQGPPLDHFNVYVDPETFYPVEIEIKRDFTRYLTFEYLPRTPANVALTNIRDQHPHAQVIG